MIYQIYRHYKLNIEILDLFRDDPFLMLTINYLILTLKIKQNYVLTFPGGTLHPMRDPRLQIDHFFGQTDMKKLAFSGIGLTQRNCSKNRK